MRAARLSRRLYGSHTGKSSICCQATASKLQVRFSATSEYSKLKITPVSVQHVQIRNLGLGPTTKDFEEPAQLTAPMTKVHATELVLHLTEEERKMLHTALVEYQSNRIKEEFEGKLTYNLHCTFHCNSIFKDRF